MTRDKSAKRAVRRRMKKTGERYAAARHVLLGERAEGETSDDAIDSYEPLMTLPLVAIDDDDRPMYLVKGQIVSEWEANAFLVEEGLEDPEILKDRD